MVGWLNAMDLFSENSKKPRGTLLSATFFGEIRVLINVPMINDLNHFTGIWQFDIVEPASLARHENPL